MKNILLVAAVACSLSVLCSCSAGASAGNNGGGGGKVPPPHFVVQAALNATVGTPFRVLVLCTEEGFISVICDAFVHVTSTDKQAILPPDFGLVHGVGGAFVTLESEGTWTVTVTSIDAPSVTGTSKPITVIPAPAASPAVRTASDNMPKHHHYKLIDIGTFGGPQSYVNPGSGNETGNYAMVLNNAGAVAGSADTSTPDPFPAFCFNEDCFVSHTFVWKNGAKKDLGALPGGASSAGQWISANGLVAGLSQNGETDPLIPGLPEVHATLWAHDRIIDLGALPEGGFESIAAAVNSHSEVAGVATNTIPDPNSMAASGFQTRAFLWENGSMQDLGTLGTGTDAQALLINERGQVVGWSYVNSVPTNACLAGFAFVTGSFIWDKENGMRDLGSLGGTCTTASDMNNDGQIVGFSNLPGDLSEHGFIWDNGSFQDLGGSLGGNFQGPFAMNEHGEAVGFATTPGDIIGHAVLWKHVGNLIDLGGVGSDQCSFATSINPKTQVVGTSGDCVSTARVFLWEDGTMVDVNALVPRDSGLHLEFAESINDRGEIAGQAFDANGNEHAFLAIPCNEEHPNLDGCDYNMVEAEESASTAGSLNTARGGAVKFNPAAFARKPIRIPRGSATGAFSMGDTPLGSAQIVGQSGASTTVQLLPKGMTFICDTHVSWGCQSKNMTRTATLTNTGSNSLAISRITISAFNFAFSETNNCPTTLAPGKSCSIGITYHHVQPSTGHLFVTDNASGSPQTIFLSGYTF
jgi:probable HAF family extracellular repeat protein